MPDKKKISELQSVLLGNSDYFAVAHDNSGVRESGKVSTVEIGEKVNHDIEYNSISKKVIDHQNPIDAINDLQDYIIDSILPTATESSTLISIPDGLEAFPVKSYKTTIDMIQASGTPTPDAPLPISGRSQMSVTHTNRNLLGGNKLLANAQVHLPNGTTDLVNKTFTFSASETPPDSTSFSLGMTFKEKTRYTIILTCSKSSGTGTNIRVRYTDGNSANISLGGTDKATVSYVSTSNKTILDIRKYSGSGTTTLYYDECGVFEGVLSAANLVAYVGDTRSLSLGSTVIGGELDLTTGEGKKTIGLAEFDENSGWTENTPGIYYISVSALGITTDIISCNCFEKIARGYSSTLANLQCNLNTQGTAINFKKDDITNLADWLTFVASHPIQIAYPLATPEDITVTPQAFTPHQHYNGFYTDCGTSTIQYKADLQRYIDKKTGGV